MRITAAKLIFSLIFISYYNHCLAREGDCVYALGNKLNAHCVYITAPERTSRYLEVRYNHQMAITSCVDNTILPFTFSKEMIGEDGLVEIGTNTAEFYQCVEASCANKKFIGIDKFTVNRDKTVNPDRFNVMIDNSFGKNCKNISRESNDMVTVVVEKHCVDFPYCVTVKAPNGVNKFVKAVSNNNSAITYCTSNKNIFALGSYTSPGQHTIDFYQCDSLSCDKQKLLAKEKIIISPPHQFDHGRAMITIDPSFGANCTASLQEQ